MTDFEFPLDDDGNGDGFPPDDDWEPPVEPGRPSLENAVFVLLGAAATVAVIYHVATLFA